MNEQNLNPQLSFISVLKFWTKAALRALLTRLPPVQNQELDLNASILYVNNSYFPVKASLVNIGGSVTRVLCDLIQGLVPPEEAVRGFSVLVILQSQI